MASAAESHARGCNVGWGSIRRYTACATVSATRNWPTLNATLYVVHRRRNWPHRRPAATARVRTLGRARISPPTQTASVIEKLSVSLRWRSGTGNCSASATPAARNNHVTMSRLCHETTSGSRTRTPAAPIPTTVRINSRAPSGSFASVSTPASSSRAAAIARQGKHRERRTSPAGPARPSRPLPFVGSRVLQLHDLVVTGAGPGSIPRKARLFGPKCPKPHGARVRSGDAATGRRLGQTA